MKHHHVILQKNVGFNSPESQKHECERWLSENKSKYPNSWVQKDGYTAQKREWYPQFHFDWNHLMEAVKRLNKKGIKLEVVLDIFDMWELVLKCCKS